MKKRDYSNQNSNEFMQMGRINWLRAAVLGANDGIISTSSLLIGIAAANSSQNNLLITGIAALIAGAMSMAAGEYISVSSQKDTEKAAIKFEQKELETNLPKELEELTEIYIKKGLDSSLAREVAQQLMERDALATHIRDELGITEIHRAKPIQAAFSSAISFSLGSFLPIIVAFISPRYYFIPILFLMAILFLAFLGGLAARIGGSNLSLGIIRVTILGTLSMVLTATIGSLFKAVV